MVVEPLRYLASCVKLDYSEFESNLVVLSLLYSASLSRITLVSSDAVDKRRQLLESGKDPGLSKFHSGDLLRMLNVGYPLFVILLMGLPTTSDISSPPLVYFIYVLLLQYFGYASIALGSSRKGHKARFFGPLGIALAFVFIAGAINAGLSR